MKNRINSNTGNLLFYSGVARAVMTGDAVLESFFVEDVDHLLRNLDQLNAEYECALIPLANAFRVEYVPALRALTRFVRAVRIPCYVIGVGLQARDEAELRGSFPFDGDVRDFVSAVLDRSALLGVRGEYTAAYLRRLGFTAERHFAVIGCPSAYLYGPEFPQIHAKPFSEVRRAAMSAGPNLPEKANALLRRGLSEFEEVCFIPQRQRELWILRYGYRFSARSRSQVPDFYPLSRRHPLYRQGNMAGFLSARSWIGFLRDRVDFAFGSRIHGNLAALLAGVPALLVSCDLRTRELARCLGVPWVAAEDLDEKTSVRALYENADFAEFGRRYPENFRRFVDFLNANGIPNIYTGGASALGDAPFDRALAQVPDAPILRPGDAVPFGERLRSMEMYAQAIRKRLRR